MEIVFHLGVHLTDEGRLAAGLARNAVRLAAEGIAVAELGPERKRAEPFLAGETPPEPGFAPALLSALFGERPPARAVIADEHLLGPMRSAATARGLYSEAPERLARLAVAFPDARLRFSIALRNPATFLPDLASSLGVDAAGLIGGADPLSLRWPPLIEAIRKAVPIASITLWCHEDAPILWPEILRAVSGHDPVATMEGRDAFLAELLAPEGLSRMRAYIAEYPPASDARWRHVTGAFLEKFGLPQALEMEIDMPDWSDAEVAALTEAYDADLNALRAIPGVTVLG
jgi:hypothetical protein